MLRKLKKGQQCTRASQSSGEVAAGSFERSRDSGMDGVSQVGGCLRELPKKLAFSQVGALCLYIGVTVCSCVTDLDCSVMSPS